MDNCEVCGEPTDLTIFLLNGLIVSKTTLGSIEHLICDMCDFKILEEGESHVYQTTDQT